jgi:hypothetical protein
VPTLRLDCQPARIIAPIVRWGSVSRATRHGGTWCFYCDDYRFGDWTSLAQRVAATEPAAVVEPNFSTFDWTPRAEALWSVYRKRRVARELQELGVPVFVDLCVAAEHRDLALLGVPRGWRAYATRGFEARPEDVTAEFKLAAGHAGVAPLMLVFGGGPRVAAVAGQLGAVHVRAPRNISGAAA